MAGTLGKGPAFRPGAVRKPTQQSPSAKLMAGVPTDGPKPSSNQRVSGSSRVTGSK
jgi:hypothetical protein